MQSENIIKTAIRSSLVFNSSQHENKNMKRLNFRKMPNIVFTDESNLVYSVSSKIHNIEHNPLYWYQTKGFLHSIQ